MISVLEDVETVVRSAGTPRDVYEHVAPRYDHFRDLWLKWAGAEAEAAMLEDLAAALQPGSRVLDAGCGTGALSRRIRQMEPTAELVMLDLSPAMLAGAADVAGQHVVGSVSDLPFGAQSFDIVVAAWVIETIPDPGRAVSEMLRVLRPGGLVVYTFCSMPSGFVSRAGTAALRAAVHRGFAGEFLNEERTPWHSCARSHLRRFRAGLTTEIALSSCCSVAAGVLPQNSG